MESRAIARMMVKVAEGEYEEEDFGRKGDREDEEVA